MLSEKEKQISILAVKDFSNNNTSEFYVDVQVCENGKEKYYYSNIEFKQSYDVSYMQHTVYLFWENDSKQEENDFHKRNLHGKYNTNFQRMSLNKKMLVIEDGDITMYVIKKQ